MPVSNTMNLKASDESDPEMTHEPESNEQTVKIPAHIYQRLAPLAEAAMFGSVDEYVTFVLEEVVQGEQTEMDPEQQEKVMERLRNLGYM